MQRFVSENQEILKTAIPVIGSIITTLIGAVVALKLGQKKPPQRPGKR